MPAMAEKLDSAWRAGQSGSIDLPPGSPGDHYTFVQLADTQFGMMAAMRRAQWQRLLVEAFTCGKLSLPPRVASDLASGDGSAEALGAHEEALARRCVAAINALDPPPAFVAACGDLVHAFPTDGADDGGAEHAAQVASDDFFGE